MFSQTSHIWTALRPLCWLVPCGTAGSIRPLCIFQPPSAQSHIFGINLCGISALWKPEAPRSCALASCFRTAASKGLHSLNGLWDMQLAGWLPQDIIGRQFSLCDCTTKGITQLVPDCMENSVREAICRPFVPEVNSWVLGPEAACLDTSSRPQLSSILACRGIYKVLEVNGQQLKGKGYCKPEGLDILVESYQEVWMPISLTRPFLVLQSAGSGRWCLMGEPPAQVRRAVVDQEIFVCHGLEQEAQVKLHLVVWRWPLVLPTDESRTVSLFNCKTKILYKLLLRASKPTGRQLLASRWQLDANAQGGVVKLVWHSRGIQPKVRFMLWRRHQAALPNGDRYDVHLIPCGLAFCQLCPRSHRQLSTHIFVHCGYC